MQVSDRQSVGMNAELITVEAADLESRDKKADIGIASARAELARMPASRMQQENYQVLQERLAQAMAEKQAVTEEFDRQVLRAGQAGIIPGFAPGLSRGRWSNPRHVC